MFWIIQENFKDEAGYDDFINIFINNKIPYQVIKVVPFVHEIIPDINPLGDVMAWGGTVMDAVAKKKNWQPGTFLNSNFDQLVWHEKYKNYLLNGDAKFSTIGKVTSFYGDRFIRPILDLKSFSGQLINGEDFEEWKRLLFDISDTFSTVTLDTIISISSPKIILTEARFFIVNGKVITGSYYKMDGYRNHQEITDPTNRLWQLAQTATNQWKPAYAFCLDVALHENTPKIIEINCINSSGFYACNMINVIKLIHEGSIT